MDSSLSSSHLAKQPGLLRLPEKLRARIFRTAGLRQDSFVSSSEAERFTETREKMPQRLRRQVNEYGNWVSEEKIRLSASMLRVNKQFHAECMDIFYGENRLLLDLRDDTAMAAFDGLGSRACAVVKNVHVLIHDGSDFPYWETDDTQLDRPLSRNLAQPQVCSPTLLLQKCEYCSYFLRTKFAPPGYKSDTHCRPRSYWKDNLREIVDSLGEWTYLTIDMGPKDSLDDDDPSNYYNAAMIRAFESTINISRSRRVSLGDPVPTFALMKLCAELQNIVIQHACTSVGSHLTIYDLCRRFNLHEVSPRRVCCGNCGQSSWMDLCFCPDTHLNGTPSSPTCTCLDLSPFALLSTSEGIRSHGEQAFFISHKFCVEGTVEAIYKRLASESAQRLRLVRNLSLVVLTTMDVPMQDLEWDLILQYLVNNTDTSNLMLTIQFVGSCEMGRGVCCQYKSFDSNEFEMFCRKLDLRWQASDFLRLTCFTKEGYPSRGPDEQDEEARSKAFRERRRMEFESTDILVTAWSEGQVGTFNGCTWSLTEEVLPPLPSEEAMDTITALRLRTRQRTMGDMEFYPLNKSNVYGNSYNHH